MIRPLTRKTRKGVPLRRPPEVERELSSAVGLSRDELVACCAVLDRSSSDYLRSELLVHFLRNARRENNLDFFQRLFRHFFARAKDSLERNVSGRIDDAETIREEVLSMLGRMFGEDVDDANELDFFECRFDAALAALRKSEIRRTRRHFARSVPIRGPDADDDEKAIVAVQLLFDPRREDLDFRKRLVAAIELLKPDLREVAELMMDGLQIESKDPAVDTVSRRLDLTDRAIRYRIKRLKDVLASFWEELQ